MTNLTKQEIFALEEFKALRREIDGQEAILDRIMSRAVTLIAFCYLLVVFERLPFTQGQASVPYDIQLLLVYSPVVIAVVSWIDYANRYAHLKVLARYIEQIETTFGFNDGGQRKAWERTLRSSESARDLFAQLRRLRHHLNWIMIAAATVVAAGLLVPLIQEKPASAPATVGAPQTNAPAEAQGGQIQ